MLYYPSKAIHQRFNPSTYMEVTDRKQIKATHTIKLQIQQNIEAIHTIKLQVQQNWKLQIQQTSLSTCTCFVLDYFKVCSIDSLKLKLVEYLVINTSTYSPVDNDIHLIYSGV